MATYNVNTDLVTGNNIMLYISGATNTPIAFAKSCDLSVSSASIDTTNKMSGMFKSTLGGQISWTCSVTAMYTRVSGDTSFDTLLASQLTGAPLNIVIGVTSDATQFTMTTGYYSGTVRITSLNMKAEENAIVTFDASFEGSGALTKLP